MSKNFSCRVFSFNVLSPNLASPSFYPTLNPQHLFAETRWKSIRDKLVDEMRKSAVISLQEMNTDWAGAMVALCQEKNYTYIPAQYGKAFNGHMGVGIAVPNDKFRIDTCNIQRIADSRRFVKEPEAPESIVKSTILFPFRFVKSFFLFLWRELGLRTLWRRVFPSPKGVELSPNDVWRESLSRLNFMITVKLTDRSSGGSVCVSNYHVPCMFWSPQVMMIHTALAAQHVQRTAGDTPHVLLGDFNLKPDSPMYKYITSGSVLTTDPAYPPPYSSMDKWDLTLKEPLHSAYVEVNGCEPEFTNYTESERGPFVGTLDYIFLSSGCKAVSVDKLPTMSEAKPSPSEGNPSDHWAIGADIEVTSQ